MLEKPLAKLEEMEKRLNNLIKSAAAAAASKAKAQELERELKGLSENLSREKTQRAESEKSAATQLAESDSRAKRLEDRVAMEKKLRAEAADRVSALVRDLEEDKPGHE